METPHIQYAWNGDVALAYQVFGEGPVDLLYLQGYCSHLDLAWESPYLARFLGGLGAQARVIATDRRGWGLSDRFSPDAVPPMETLTDDLLTVMDSAGSSRAVVFGSWDCGVLAMLFAATHPERVAGLILCDTFPTFAVTEDTPTMPTSRQWRRSTKRCTSTGAVTSQMKCGVARRATATRASGSGSIASIVPRSRRVG